jgi:signal peptidase I
MKDTSRGEAGAQLIAETVRAAGCAQFRVLGGSMRPWLRGSDVVEVRKEPLERVRRGDVVAYARGGGLFVHRVIGKRTCDGRLVLITKGDAFCDPDAPIDERELLGRVVCATRGNRRIALDARGRRALGVLLARVSATMPHWYPRARALKRWLFAAVS